MPKGVPVATVAIGNAYNAGLLAVSILAQSDSQLLEKMIIYKENIATESRAKNNQPQFTK